MKLSIKVILFVFLVAIAFNSYIDTSFSQEINKQINFLNTQIKNNKSKIDKLKDKKQSYEDALEDVNNQQASLKNQLAILDNRVASIELETENTKSRMDRTNLEISKINFEINQKNQKIEKEKEHISELLNLIYKQEDVDTLEMLLLNNTLSEFLNKVKYLKDINNEMRGSVSDLKRYKEDLEEGKIALNEKNQNLEKLKEELLNQMNAVKHEKEKKELVLEQTENSEKKYQTLLKDAKLEQKQAAVEIVNFEKEVRAKLKELEASKEKITLSSDGFYWPVPSHYITAYFHDPGYPFRYIFEHPAIDIRAPQSTEIKAVASGYVGRVKWDTSSNYAYVMIIHADGLSSVYGHISKPLVKNEEYVLQGQTIALSGGMPGTSGAGRLTTGPHLHLEIRLNGIPVNPLEYLTQ